MPKRDTRPEVVAYVERTGIHPTRPRTDGASSAQHPRRHKIGRTLYDWGAKAIKAMERGKATK